MAGTLEYELLNKNLEMVDGHAVKAPEDYQNPEQLYEALIARVRKYHPSADISLIEKAYKLSREAPLNKRLPHPETHPDEHPQCESILPWYLPPVSFISKEGAQKHTAFGHPLSILL